MFNGLCTNGSDVTVHWREVRNQWFFYPRLCWFLGVSIRENMSLTLIILALNWPLNKWSDLAIRMLCVWLGYQCYVVLATLQLCYSISLSYCMNRTVIQKGVMAITRRTYIALSFSDLFYLRSHIIQGLWVNRDRDYGTSWLFFITTQRKPWKLEFLRGILGDILMPLVTSLSL